tara:strand:+ start:483 stop:1367 length:885 start_codon:yes stop_codon:yes gene_type:complete
MKESSTVSSLQELDQLLHSQEWFSALSLAQDLYKRVPTAPGVIERLMSIFVHLENWKDLVSLLLEARNCYQLWPKGSDFYMGQALLELGSFDEAAQYLKLAVEDDTADGWSYHFLGKALRNLGELQDALACQLKAADMLPEFPWASFEASEILVLLQKPNHAAVEAREALKRCDPSSSEIIEKHWNHAIYLVKLEQINSSIESGEVNGALDEISKIIHKYPDDKTLNSYLQEIFKSDYSDLSPKSFETTIDVLEMNKQVDEIEKIVEKIESGFSCQEFNKNEIAADKLGEINYE